MISLKNETRLKQLLFHVGDMSLKCRAYKLIEGLDLKDGDKIADLGCGDGYYLYLLSSLPTKLELIGIDNDSVVLNNAKKNLNNNKIKIINSDLSKIPLKSSSVDKIIITEVLEHVSDDKKVLSEMYRILKPKGVVVLTVPNLNYPFLWDPINWIIQRVSHNHIKTGFWSGIWAGHQRLYIQKDLELKIKESNFNIQTTKQLTSWCLPFNHHLVNLVARFLYDVKPSSSLSDPISKFKESKKPFFINAIFKCLNLFDKLNDVVPLGNGLNIYVKATR